MEDCIHLGQVVSSQKRGDTTIEVCRCNYLKASCTRDDHGILIPGGAMNVCAGCPKRNAVIEQPKPLSTLERITTAAKVMASTAITGMADESLIEKRLAICQSCPHFKNSGCELCGCSVVREKVLLNKLAHITSVCPDKTNPRW